MVTWGTVKSIQTISISTDIIKGATDRLQAQTTEIENINKEIAEKATIISTLASESLNQLTSADSFCYVDAAVHAPKNDSVGLTLFHRGKYPLSDVFIEVRDLAATERFWQDFKERDQTQLSVPDVVQASRGLVVSKNVGTVIPDSGTFLTSVPYASEPMKFLIWIIARNGFYRETITLAKRKDGNGWAVDEHLFKRQTDKEVQIWEFVSPN
jgi:hypothetical protein